MRASRLGAFGALGAVLLVGLAAGVAPAATTPPSVTASHAPVAGSPSAISCDGFVDAHVTVTGHAGTTGTARAIMLTLDLSGSMNVPTTKFADLKRAATDTLDALNAADGSADHTIGGNSVGIVVYHGTSVTTITPTHDYDALAAAITGLGTPTGDSPHNRGIDAASAALSSSAGKAIELISDGQATGTLLTATNTAATKAKAAGALIVPIAIGTDATVANLEGWATTASVVQHPAPGGSIDKNKLLADLDAQVVVPATFTLGETLGTNFSAANAVASNGAANVTGVGTGTLQWTGSLADNQSATLDFRAQRNNAPVFATTNEAVSTMSLTVGGGGTATITPPAAISIDVLPCGATPIAATTCSGASCSVSGTQGGIQYSASAGTPPAGTSLTLSSLNAPPPMGVCDNFVARTQGAEYDVRPLTTDSTFKMTISKAALGTRRWFETDVCLGSNLKFITAIRSLSNLSPDATFVPGGTVPGRWWGLLPSIPRFEFFPGRGFVLGPYITSRSVDAAGNASITFKIPFVPNSVSLGTTDGKAAYDPKLWGG